MKALVLLTTCYPYGRGEEFLETELPHLVEAFGRVVVFSFAVASEQTRALPDGVEVYRFHDIPRMNKLPGIIKTLFHPEFRAEIDFARDYLKHSPALSLRWEMLFYLVNARVKADFAAQTLQTWGIEPVLFYSYWNNRFAVVAAMLKAWYKRPAVSRAHGYDVLFQRSRWNYIPYKKYLARELDAVFFNTHYTQEEFIHKTQRKDNLFVAPLGTHSEPIVNPGSDDGILRIASCSGVNAGKRVHRIIQALAQMPGVRIHWWHLGTGPEMLAVQNEAHRLLDTCENIVYEFLGHCPHDQILAFYRTHRIDLFVSMTQSEGGAPVSMMEAGAFGIPVIAPAVGGVPEIVESGKNGYLLPPDAKAEDLSRALEEWQALPDEARRTMRTTAVARQREKYDADRNYRHLTEIMKSIAGSYL